MCALLWHKHPIPVEDKKFWLLHAHRLFDQMNDDEVNGLCIISRYKEAHKGERIFFTGEAEDRIYILKQGIVKIVQNTESGDEVVKDVIHEHDLFGQLPGSSLEDTEFAVAATPVVSICTFRKADFEKVLTNSPQVSLKFARLMGDKMRVLEQKYNSLVFKDLRTRLLEFLRRYSSTFGQGKTTVPNYLTQEDIAQLIGGSRQSVASLLNELERTGYLVYGRKEIILTEKLLQENF